MMSSPLGAAGGEVTHSAWTIASFSCHGRVVRADLVAGSKLGVIIRPAVGVDQTSRARANSARISCDSSLCGPIWCWRTLPIRRRAACSIDLGVGLERGQAQQSRSRSGADRRPGCQARSHRDRSPSSLPPADHGVDLIGIGLVQKTHRPVVDVLADRRSPAAIWTSFFRLGASTIAWTLIRPLWSYE